MVERNSSSTFTGNVSVNQGTLTVTGGNNNSNPIASSLGNMTTAGRTVTVAAGAKLSLNASDAMGSYQYKTPVVFVANGGTIENGAGAFMSIGDIILMNGGRINTVNGANPGYQVFNLRGSITVSGTSGSTITTTGSSQNGIHLGGTTIAATTFNVGATGDPVADLTVSAPLLNEVYNTGALVKTGAGKMVLSAANTYTGATTVTQGTLQLAKTASLYNSTPASWTAANINVKSGGTLAFNVGGTGEFTTGNVTTLLTNLAASSSATNGMNAGAALGFDTTNASGSNFTIADGIADTTGASGGARGLTKLGTNRLTLSGTNTYGGGTTINAGTLNVNADAALGNSAGAVGISNGATLQAAGTVTTAARTLTLGAGGGVIDTNGNTVNFNSGSTVTGTALTKSGTGTLNFGVSSGLTGLGALAANNGTTHVNSALGTGTSTVSVTAATTLKFGSVSQTLSSLTIGAGSTVTFTSGLASFSGGSGGKAPSRGGGSAVVPEPGTLGLLLVGALGMLNRRRRQA